VNNQTKTEFPITHAASPPAIPSILIADDNPAIQEMLRWAFELAGCRAMPCTGENAILAWIEQARPSLENPPLILLDLSASTPNATDFLGHLRTEWRGAFGQLPQIIVLTTSKQVLEGLSTTERVLLKPFHVRDLLALVREIV
jgi:two-component system chemotaxis response regulator CheY